jgi:NAD-reducing hydrogenase large subunit
VALGVGRFNVPPTADELDEIRRIATDVKELCGTLIAGLNVREEGEAHVPFPAGHNVNFLSYGGLPGQERFRAYDRAGERQEEFDRQTFGDHVSEMRVDWSLAKFPYLSGLGFPEGIFLVGPLSRLYLEDGVLADPELSELAVARLLGDPAALQLDYLDECRLLEIYWAAKRILSYVDEVDLAQMAADGVDLEGSGWGIGVVEAPRGVLVHSYTVNGGALERMRLLVATQFNNAYINLVLRDLAERYVDGDGLSEEGERIIAHAVRVFDPCLTCATH